MTPAIRILAANTAAALLVGAYVLSTGAHAAEYSATTFDHEKTLAEATFSVESSKCSTQSGSAREACLGRAESTRAESLAAAAASREKQFNIEDADYMHAAARCNGLAQTPRAHCLTQATLTTYGR